MIESLGLPKLIPIATTKPLGMAAKLTHAVNIEIISNYIQEYSKPEHNRFLFSYQIKIENQNAEAIKLLTRHWYIFDSNGQVKEVAGEGVIGEQPIIKPGETFEYESYCELRTDMGMMWGSYLMRNVETEKLFEAPIPEFQLICPARLN